jgi:hypothetical protein
MFGDSQVAGHGVSNGARFSDLLEKLIPNLEIFNYGINGIGTDQQYLTYLDYGNVEHDLLIIGVYIHDVERVNSRFLKFQDENANEVFYAKPYFEVKDGQLVLGHVPVPKECLTRKQLPPANVPQQAAKQGLYRIARGAMRSLLPHPYLRNAARQMGIFNLVQRLGRFQLAPGYDTSQDNQWLLLREILATWIRESPVPVLIVPIPMWAYIDGTSDAGNYCSRFMELASSTGCQIHDPLADLQKYATEERRNFRFKNDPGHLSTAGHNAIALSLKPVIERIMNNSQSRIPQLTDDGI